MGGVRIPLVGGWVWGMVWGMEGGCRGDGRQADRPRSRRTCRNGLASSSLRDALTIGASDVRPQTVAAAAVYSQSAAISLTMCGGMSRVEGMPFDASGL
jgi:hypothetical protein